MDRSLYKQNDKATLCSKGSCVTVYGETARLIQGVVLFTVLFVSAAYIAKALR